jgi:hypothetical protein
MTGLESRAAKSITQRDAHLPLSILTVETQYRFADPRRTVGAPPNGRQRVCRAGQGMRLEVGVPKGVLVLPDAPQRGMIVALLVDSTTNELNHSRTEVAMGSALFSWILAAGIFSMSWFFYLAIRQSDTRSQPVGHQHACKRTTVRRTV